MCWSEPRKSIIILLNINCNSIYYKLSKSQWIEIYINYIYMAQGYTTLRKSKAKFMDNFSPTQLDNHFILYMQNNVFVRWIHQQHYCLKSIEVTEESKRVESNLIYVQRKSRNMQKKGKKQGPIKNP